MPNYMLALYNLIYCKMLNICIALAVYQFIQTAVHLYSAGNISFHYTLLYGIDATHVDLLQYCNDVLRFVK